MVRPGTALRGLALTLMVIGLSSCARQDDAVPTTAIKGEAMRVAASSLDDVKPVAATVTTRQMGEAIARVSGVLTSLKVREGDQVTAGQVIGHVQDQRLNLQTGAYDAAANAAEAQARLAHTALARTQALFDKGVYAQARLDQDRAAAEAADANVRAARAQASASGEGARQGAILAPATGRVLHAAVPPGSVVMAGQSVVTVTAGPRIVRIELPEAQGRSLGVGQVLMLDAGGSRVAATVSEIYPSVTAGQLVADVTAPGIDDALIGQRVTAYVGVGRRQAVVLPRRFVATRYGLDYVRLVQGRTVMETTVQTAPTGDPDRVEIIGGLNAGDTVLSYGAAR